MSCKHFKERLEEDDRYFIDSEEDLDCVLCLIDRKGSMTQQEVARLLQRN